MIGRLFGRQTVEPNVFIHTDVIRRSQLEIARSPSVEVGGKFVGLWNDPNQVDARIETPALHLNRPSELNQQGRLEQPVILILGTISSGPEATQTATSLIPDGKFQYRVFRQIERHNPSVEHLGSWHSHHPNGLRGFSHGDLKGYIESVNDASYNLDLFVAGLCVDQQGLANGNFELFWRGKGGSRQSIRPRILSDATSLQPLIDRIEADAAPQEATGREYPGPDSLSTLTTVDRRLRSTFNRVTGPVKSADSLTWIIESSTRADKLAVTVPISAPENAGVSVVVEDDSGQLTLDLSLSKDPGGLFNKTRELLSKLGLALNDRER